MSQPNLWKQKQKDTNDVDIFYLVMPKYSLMKFLYFSTGCSDVLYI